MFPPRLPWINVATLRMDQQRGRPVLVEFWDFCRPNSLRTLPYLTAWHERYGERAARDRHPLLGVRAVGRPRGGRGGGRAARGPLPGGGRRRRADLAGVREPRLAGALPVQPGGRLFDFHYGEGGYEETERAIQELLGVERRAVIAPRRPEDVPGALLVPQSEDVEGPYSGPYEAGGVWAVLDGARHGQGQRPRDHGRSPRRLRADRPPREHRRHLELSSATA